MFRERHTGTRRSFRYAYDHNKLKRDLTALKVESYLPRMIVMWILAPRVTSASPLPTPLGPEASSSGRLDFLFEADDLEEQNTASV